MARKPSVRYWPSRKGGGYFCVYRGRQHELALGPDDAPTGPTYLAALATFRELLEGDSKQAAKSSKPPPVTVRESLETYLKHISKTKKPGTVEIRLRSFTPFVNFKPEGECYGEMPVETLTHQHVYDFLRHMERPRKAQRKKEQKSRKPVAWGPGSQRNCLLGLNAAFNWAARSGVIARNPLAGIEKPSPASRGAESLIGNTTEEIEANHQRILAASPAAYRPLLQALKDTGARPGEIAAATAADFNAELGAFNFHKEMTRRGERFSHKTAKRKDRVIFLRGETLRHVHELVQRYPNGPLFRRNGGKSFKKVNIVNMFTKVQKRMKMPTLTAYSYRHTYATELLKAGMDVDTLSELMGNSPLVIRQHYSHLLADAKGLREKLERFTAVAGTRTPPCPGDGG
jgi:integrase